MQCKLIQNFLNLPGIIGFSLISLNGASQPYSVGFSQGNSPDQYPQLVQGIQQIIKTTPASFEFCSFQFGPYQVELHKAENGAVLIVFSEGSLPSHYSKSISELMQFIKVDYAALIESIRSIKSMNLGQEATVSLELQTANVDDVVAAMNSLSQITSRYLGSQLVANHWRTNRSQDMAGIDKFRISVDGVISVTDMGQQLSAEQLVAIRLWTKRFHQRCTRIIRDYDALVEQALLEQHWQLLFGR